MPKKLIQRLVPGMNSIREHKSLHLFGDLLHDPNLWHLNRRSVAGAFAVGLFTAFIPVPGQMLIAAALAIFFRVNLPLSVMLVLITNPITIPPLYYLAYKVGNAILGNVPGTFNFELSFDWLVNGLIPVWKPFLLGCFVLGALAALIGYSAIRLYWRMYVLRNRERRRLRKRNGTSSGVK